MRGTIVYIKTSLTGDEPGDVLQYSLKHSLFPHQKTIDQYFDESQFESYRALGHHTSMVILKQASQASFKKASQTPPEENSQKQPSKKGADQPDKPPTQPKPSDNGARQVPPHHVQPGSETGQLNSAANTTKSQKEDLERNLKENQEFLERMFKHLHAMWYPVTENMAAMGGQHSRLYAELAGKFTSSDGTLDEVARTFFRNSGSPTGSAPTESASKWHPEPEFLVYSMMIELMHRVFEDLELETTADHPHNEGWVSMFRDWAESQGFKNAWDVVKGNYDIRFRIFCNALDQSESPSKLAG
jgi:hypothetical protein